MALFRRSRDPKELKAEIDRLQTATLRRDVIDLRGTVDLMMSSVGKAAQAGWLYYLHHTEEPGATVSPAKVTTLVVRDFGLVKIGDKVFPAPKLRVLKEEMFNQEDGANGLVTDVTIAPNLKSNYVIDSVFKPRAHVKDPIRIPTFASMPRITIDDTLAFSEMTAERTRIAHVKALVDGKEIIVRPFGTHGNFEDHRAAVDVAIRLIGEVSVLHQDRFGSLDATTRQD